jgi:signal transduction histidine kinase/ligand-binding sensor domain-containing protein/CheY-like chemotaxis protein
MNRSQPIRIKHAMERSGHRDGSVLGALLLFSLAAYPAAIPRPNGIIQLPVVDRQDIRFLPLSGDGHSAPPAIQSIAQDNYGFLWVGSSVGLYRYDGYTLKPYRHTRSDPNSLSDDSVRIVYKDRAGMLWIGSNYGGLDRLDPAHDTFTHYRHAIDDSRSLSSDAVIWITQDHTGALWVGTRRGLDRLDQDGRGFVHYRHDERDPGSLSSDAITFLFEDRQGSLWVGTLGGLNKLDRATGKFTRFVHDPMNPHSLGDNYVRCIREDQSGVLWVGTRMGNGLSALDVKTGRFTRYSFHAEDPGSQSFTGVIDIFEDEDRELWVGTVERGLLKLDRGRKQFTRYSTDPANPNSLPAGIVHSLFKDAEGVLWVGTDSGLSRVLRKASPIAVYRHEAANPNSLKDNMIWSVLADSQECLWIGTDSGLQRLDRRTGKFTLYQHDPNDSRSLSFNQIWVMREDPSGVLWFGTYGGGLDRFDRKTGRFVAYRHDPKNPASLSGDLVISLLVDRQGVLWAGTHGGGLNRLDAKTGRFKVYRHDPNNPHSLSHDNINAILEDRSGVLWLGTLDGLNRFDPSTEQFTVYRHDPKDPDAPGRNRISSLWEDGRGMLWIGTQSGLNQLDRTHGIFTRFTTEDGLPDDVIQGILEDRQGYLWLPTYNGLSRFHPPTRTFRNFSESDGLPGNSLNPHEAGGSGQSPSGEIVVGTSNGLAVFSPDRLTEINLRVPPVVLTDFHLFNKPVPQAVGSPLRSAIWATDSLTLTHAQSIFTLEFAALSYQVPEKNRYRYRLEGLETAWNEVDSRRRVATYTSLPAGKYVFRVQASNNDQVWNERGATLAITVLPAWWATWWFRGILGLTMGGLAFAVYWSRVRSMRLRAEKLELQVQERTRELQVAKDVAEGANQAKSIFLSNMSHELRTPLNAILGFSNLMRSAPGIPPEERKDLDIINRSGEHLLSLINDVLDMARIDSGRIAVENAPLDLKELMRDIVDLMRVRAGQKCLELFLEHSSAGSPLVWADAQKLRQVLLNLIGNAVKHTERGGVFLRVDLEPADDSQHLRLAVEVRDTGIGISAEDQARIFEPFVQVGKAATRRGTGLGLAITRKYVELMGGTIRVASTPGIGSLFRVELPVRKAEKSEMPKSRINPGRIVGLEPGQPRYRVLIVEDQVENWLLLRRILESSGFEVQVAENGAAGIEKFLAWRPHFIWMDWRLPGMDGLAATRHIRALDGGKDVKIAILTAFAFTEQRTEAVAAGADDFVRKPFQPEAIFDCLSRHLGVRYTYQEAPAEGRVGALRPEALEALPKELRLELVDALILLDIDRITELIGRISEHDAALGVGLAGFAERFEYTPILNALAGRPFAAGG